MTSARPAATARVAYAKEGFVLSARAGAGENALVGQVPFKATATVKPSLTIKTCPGLIGHVLIDQINPSTVTLQATTALALNTAKEVAKTLNTTALP